MVARLNRPVVSVGLLMLFVGCLLIFRNPADQPQPALYVLIAVGLALVVIASRRHLPDWTPAPAEAPHPLRLRVRPAPLVMAATLTVSQAWLAVGAPTTISFFAHLGLWAAIMALLYLAVWRGDKCDAEPAPGATPATPVVQRIAQIVTHVVARHWPILLVMGVALVLRVGDLDTFPNLMDRDEASFAWMGVRLNTERGFLVSPFEPNLHSFPALFQALVGVSIGVFGQTLVAARLPAAILGWLGVGATYLLGNEIGGRRVGLVAAAFVATWPYHLLFSRLTLNQTGDPLFGALMTTWLLRGMRTRAASDYVLAGISLGLAQYFYVGGRVLVPVVVAFLAWQWLAARRDPAHRLHWGRLGLMSVCAFLITLPHHAYLWHTGTVFTTRFWPVSDLVERFQALEAQGDRAAMLTLAGRQITRTVGGLFTTPERELWYGDSSSLLSWPGGPLFLLGLSVVVLCLRRGPGLRLVLIYGGAVLVGGGLITVDPPNYQRFFSGVVPFAMLVGIGAVWLAHLVGKLIPAAWQGRISPQTLGVVVGSAACACNLIFLALVYIPEAHYLRVYRTHVTNWVVRTIRELHAQGLDATLITNPSTRRPSADSDGLEAKRVFASLGVEYNPIVRYLTPGIPVTVFDGTQTFPVELVPRLRTPRPLMVIVPLAYEDTLRNLVAVYGLRGQIAWFSVPTFPDQGFLVYLQTNALLSGTSRTQPPPIGYN